MLKLNDILSKIDLLEEWPASLDELSLVTRIPLGLLYKNFTSSTDLAKKWLRYKNPQIEKNIQELVKSGYGWSEILIEILLTNCDNFAPHKKMINMLIQKHFIAIVDYAYEQLSAIEKACPPSGFPTQPWVKAYLALYALAVLDFWLKDSNLSNDETMSYADFELEKIKNILTNN